MPGAAQTPYEAHVTMLIKCLSVCVYSFMVMGVMDSSLMFMLLAAERLKPMCFISLAMQLWFGMVTFFMAKQVLRFLMLVFFSDACKHSIAAPDFSALLVRPDGDAVKLAANSTTGKESILASLFCDREDTPTKAETSMPKGPSTPDARLADNSEHTKKRED